MGCTTTRVCHRVLRSLRDDKDFVASVIEGGLLGMAAFGVQPVLVILACLLTSLGSCRVDWLCGCRCH